MHIYIYVCVYIYIYIYIYKLERIGKLPPCTTPPPDRPPRRKLLYYYYILPNTIKTFLLRASGNIPRLWLDFRQHSKTPPIQPHWQWKLNFTLQCCRQSLTLAIAFTLYGMRRTAPTKRCRTFRTATTRKIRRKITKGGMWECTDGPPFENQCFDQTTMRMKTKWAFHTCENHGFRWQGDGFHTQHFHTSFHTKRALKLNFAIFWISENLEFLDVRNLQILFS